MTLKIRNWRKFQHFKDRRPPWIKLYRDLLDERDWHLLCAEASKFLVNVWLLASEDETQQGLLPDVPTIAFRLRLTEKETLQRLEEVSKWVGQDDIATISERYHDGPPETETETETETEAKADALRATPQNGESENGRKKAATSLSESWSPSVSSTQKAEKLNLTQAEISRETEKFRNNARQNDRRAVDWDAAFDNWCIKTAEFLKRTPQQAKTSEVAFPASPDTPRWQAWRTYLQDLNTPVSRSLVRELDRRRLEGRDFAFEVPWPPGYAEVA
jgi:hypothetical protein